MPDLAQLAAAYRAAAQAVQDGAPALVETMAQTQRVLAQQRVQEMGLTDRAYSQNFIPTFLFEGKELNAGGAAYIAAHKLGNWGGFRAAQGLRSDVVNLTYSGRMFQSLQVQILPATGFVYQAQIVASDVESAKKLRYNQQRYGDFLAPTSAEQGEINLVGIQGVEAIIKQFV